MILKIRATRSFVIFAFRFWQSDSTSDLELLELYLANCNNIHYTGRWIHSLRNKTMFVGKSMFPGEPKCSQKDISP